MRTTVLILIAIALSATASETATMTGIVHDLAGDTVSGASVELFPARETDVEKTSGVEPSLENHPWLFTDEPLYQATTDDKGWYSLEGILPDTYDFICRSSDYEPAYALDIAVTAGEKLTYDFILEYMTEVKKPNIYLYPESETAVTVRLGFPAGGGVTASEPTYDDGWTVGVAPDGKIEGGYGHLFYEAQVPADWQFDRGWVVQQRQLEEFFTENLAAHGFNERETADFIEYWIPRLEGSAFYVIYPQYAREIEPRITLTVLPPPAEIFRLYYVISGVDLVDRYVSEPVIPIFHHFGFTVCEWGVVIEQGDGNRIY
ncbi:MAG: carboxypeptidase-like regulatory domain-containing protein [bacterium]|nr:carboxypeptidase-like regulatory domain-containing protein [bacterium]